MKTYFATNEEALASRKWLLIDGENQVVGRLASKIAHVLRGKHKPGFVPHNDGGDFVIVINADKIRFTGNKAQTKTYYRHTGYVGGIKEVRAGDMLDRHPDRALRLAVKRMLPKTTLGRGQLKKLRIYTGSEHPHAAQTPQALEL